MSILVFRQGQLPYVKMADASLDSSTVTIMTMIRNYGSPNLGGQIFYWNPNDLFNYFTT